ncbi:universal stress protein [Gordonibacter sp.]|uniref:universal stress protein n=1 Tax=Gordonibacter sp. TaxID=1968902 RepID=UPI002FCA4A21
MKFSNILVPFDKSEHAVHALGVARGLAEEDPAIGLHVVDIIYVSEMPPSLGLDANPYESMPPLAVDPDLYCKLVDAALAREKEGMDKAIGSLLDGLPNPVSVQAVNAMSIVDGITDYAHEYGCDLIIMGSRGLGLLRGMLGSVSYGVLRSSEIPVLIAKEPEEK